MNLGNNNKNISEIIRYNTVCYIVLYTNIQRLRFEEICCCCVCSRSQTVGLGGASLAKTFDTFSDEIKRPLEWAG